MIRYRRAPGLLGVAFLIAGVALVPPVVAPGRSSGPFSAPAATALPPGGANGADTPGTSAAVSGEVTRGGIVSWEVAGFPPGVPVYVKIDDGQLCPANAAQGACVVTSKTIGSQGTASGSFTLPSEVGEGRHRLRFLATGPAPERLGYSSRSPEFVVVPVAAGGTGGHGGTAGVVETGGGTAVVDQSVTGAEPATVTDDGVGTGPAPRAESPAAPGAGPARAPAPAVPAVPATGSGAGGAPAAGGARSTGTSGTGSSPGLLRSSAGGAATAATGGEAGSGALTPYRNLAASADTAGTDRAVPWWGIGALGSAALLALAMLVSSVAVTRPELLRRRRDT